MKHPEIVILYHGGCPDGFGGAYAAWKKFGDGADYIPVKHGKPLPEHLDGRDIYLIDFCYPELLMQELARIARSVTILDHHEGVREVATRYKGVFDTTRSGATIAWGYFHPTVLVPTLLRYVEDGDLYRFALPHSREILSYIYTLTDSFASFSHENVGLWDRFSKELDDPAHLARAIEIGSYFKQHHDHVVEHGVRRAELVHFEGYVCYLASTSSEFVSDVGNQLAKMKPPFAIVLSADAEGVRVSLRGDKSIDVAKIAQKYGGNGHPASSGFELPYGAEIPWTLVTKDEHSGH